MNKSKVHSTNYFSTFIEVAEDSKVTSGEKPRSKGELKTVAELQFELIVEHPYTFTSDEIFFRVFAIRNDLAESEIEQAQKEFFSKGQPCFRASPLTKRYGFGVHCDSRGKVAIYGIETEKYQELVSDPSIRKVKAMRSSKA
ncbi:MAG: DUF6157 family protein [Cytophagaceae bacterium]